MANLEQMKEEALKRMEKLKLHKNVLEDFKNGVLNKSERQNAIFNGILYHLDKEEEKDVIQKIKEFEEKYGGIVYHVIMTRTTMGLMYSCLYVSKHEDEWQMDNGDLEQGYCYAYVYNKDCPDCSEIGSIGINPVNGGLERIA